MSANLVVLSSPAKLPARNGVSIPVERPVIRPAEQELSSPVRNLLKWVDTANQDKRRQIEDQLVQLGSEAIPELMDGLLNHSPVTQALIVMVLLRHGGQALAAVRLFCQQVGETSQGSTLAHLLTHHFCL